MIDLALGAITSQLNQGLRRSFGVAEDVAVMANILETDGQVATLADNRIVVSLVNIERDTVSQRGSASGGGGIVRSPRTPAPVNLTLSVMFAACFASGNYAEALKFISGTAGFFQSRPVFDRQNTPELDARIDRLALDIANLSIADLSNLWSILSGRYVPSILYRVRMVSVDLDQVSGQSHPITRPRIAVAG
ncbi:MAG: DUF4255 domain-containing protein [Rubrivivax sp.]|nr:DUF4255 domain-containing protein [Rubrivivax sp.]